MNYNVKQYEDLFNKGTILLNERKLNEALVYFNKAYKLNNKDPELLCNIGVANLHLENFEKGLSWLQRALTFDSRNPITLLNIAIILSMEGKYGQAISTIKTLLEHNPSFSQARPFLMQIKRQEELFGNLMSVEKKIPKKALELFKEAMRCTHCNKLPEAVSKLNAALNKYPKFAEANLFLGIIHQMLNKSQSAMSFFDNALRLDSNLFLAWIHKGWVLDSKNDFEKAIDCYDRAIEIRPEYSSAWNNKGLALDSLERYEEAIENFDKSIELNPDFDGAWYNRGTAYKKMGQVERALSDYKQTIELNPYNENAKEQIDSLRVWSSSGVGGTMRSVHDARDYCPRCGKKNYSGRNVCPYCSTPMHGENIEQLLQDAVEAEDIGEFDRALMTFVRINDKDPTNATAWYYRGKAHCALGEFRNALSCFGKAQQLGFQAFQIMTYGLMARQNLENFKAPNLSKEHLAKVEAKHAGFFPDQNSWSANGVALQMLGQYEEAYKCYEKALEIDPDFAIAKKNKEVIYKLSQK